MRLIVLSLAQVEEVIEHVVEDNSVVMEDINQNESKSDESKSETER